MNEVVIIVFTLLMGAIYYVGAKLRERESELRKKEAESAYREAEREIKDDTERIPLDLLINQSNDRLRKRRDS